MIAIDMVTGNNYRRKSGFAKLVFGTNFLRAPVNVKHGRALNCHAIAFHGFNIEMSRFYEFSKIILFIIL